MARKVKFVSFLNFHSEQKYFVRDAIRPSSDVVIELIFGAA